jgi:hypothetical protein
MKSLQVQTTQAFLQRETGAIAGIERAVQAATAPTLGQQMLQRGAREAIADGTSREASCVSVNAEGIQVAERLVERGVLLPNGQGIQVQQAAQHVVMGESELGKRKIQDELERVEVRLKSLLCDKLEIENQQMKKQFSIDNHQLVLKHQHDNIDNKMSIVNTFAATMQLLDPLWRNDKRIVLQATDYLKNGVFNGSSVPLIENGHAASESISIGLVAFEMGVSLTNAKAVAAGKHAAKMYKDLYGEAPSKHNQTIAGNVILVNSYTYRDRGLVESAIKAVA